MAKPWHSALSLGVIAVAMSTLAGPSCDGVDAQPEPSTLTGELGTELPLDGGLLADAACPVDAEPCLTLGAPVDGAMACDKTRQVGRSTSETCPPPRGAHSKWSVEPLFKDASGAAAALGPDPAPDDGAIYCLYIWNGSVKPSLAELGEIADLQGMDLEPAPDCAVVAPLQAADIEAEFREPLARSFKAQIEAVPGNTLPQISGAIPTERVRVAVLDTVPNPAAGAGDVGAPSGGSDHGQAVGRIIQFGACPDCTAGHWPVKIDSHTALDVLEDGSWDASTGGFYGYQGRVAQSVWDAWRDNDTDPEDRNLIINLSLGWDTRYNDGPSGSVRPAVRAARAAIRFAACHDTLVLAAAGNASGGPEQGQGLMMPARWGANPASCGPDTPPVRLVYPIGGVTATDTALPNARPHARPWLVAPGAFASVSDGVAADGTPRFTRPLTGTSGATAVAAAAAALTWRYRPHLKPVQVMQRLYASSVNLNLPVDIVPPGGSVSPPSADTHRLSLCGALVHAHNEACATRPGCTPITRASLGCTGVPAGAGTPPALTAADADPDTWFTDPATTLDFDTEVFWPGCEHGAIALGDGAYPTHPCAEDQFYGGALAPWAVRPQPDINGCGFCAYSSIDELVYIYPSSDLTAPMTDAVFRTSSGTDYYVDPFGVGLSPGGYYKLSMPAGALNSAKLIYTITDKSGKTAETFSGSDPVWIID